MYKRQPYDSLKFHFCSKILPGDYDMEQLDSVVILFIKTSLKNDFFLQPDGAPIHRASLVTQYSTRNKINVLKWPSRSSDLNIVENVWGWLVAEVYECGNIMNLRQLKQILEAKIKVISSKYKIMIESMFHNYFDNLVSVIEKKGSLLNK